jgi:hypothetical protein
VAQSDGAAAERAADVLEEGAEVAFLVGFSKSSKGD